MRKEIITCDISTCGNEVDKSHHIQESIQVIFTTNQTDGSSCRPYLYMYGLDLCNKCYNHLLEGNYIYATGGQGYNTFKFK